MKIIEGIVKYLSDWRNWLTHGLVGVILLWCLLFAPIAWYYRVLILLLVIGFNVVRMRYSKKKKEQKELNNENN